MIEPVPDQTLDIQHDPDPAKDHGPARRIPHLGHAVLFFSLAVMSTIVVGAATLTFAHIHTDGQAMQHLGLQLFIQSLAYVLTLLASMWIFPRLWSKTFFRGIEWNWLAVRRYWIWIVLLGILVSFAAQLGDTHAKQTTSSLDAFFKTPLNAWMLTACGVLLFPAVEEIAFRGFLLPAFATAYDWLALDRTPAGLHRWETSTGHSIPALVFASVFSSLAFVSLHGPQLSFSLFLMSILFIVSLVLSWVRIKFHSVGCSVMMHATYNLTTFVAAMIATDFYRHLAKLS